MLAGGIAPVSATLLLINHTTTDITQIPDAWINAVKSDTKGIDFAYTSHGAYVISGLKAWEYYNSKYAFDYTDDGSNDLPIGSKLKIGARNGYDWYTDYWYGSSSIAATEAALDTGNFKYSMFEWCTELSDESSSFVNDYLEQMEAFEAAYPDITFIYTTGHADAGASDGGSNLIARNAQIRAYAIAHGKVLYDYEDIGCHNPDGTNYLYEGCGVDYVSYYADECTYDGGNWCTAWKSANPSSPFTAVADNVASWEEAHSTTGLQAAQKGAAFWWMMARLEGWDGTTVGSTPTPTPTPNPSPSPMPTPTRTPTPVPTPTLSPTQVFASSENMGIINYQGVWALDYNGNGIWDGNVIDKVLQFGKTGDTPMTADWNGDGKADIGVFRPSSGYWYLDYNKDGVIDKTEKFGKSGDISVTADWNGDGTSDVGVFRPSTGQWGLDYNKDGVTDKIVKFGKLGDIPVIADWNGDGISDVGVFRPSSGYWYLDYNKNGVTDKTVKFGKLGDIPVIADWNGDGTSDVGVFRPLTGQWGLDYNKDGVTDKTVKFGKAGDIPVVGKWI